MNKTTYIVIILIASCLASCAFSAKKKAEAITALEESLKQSSKNHVSDTAKVKELLADYEYYTSHYEKDSLTPIYLMRSGNFNRAIGLSEKAVKCYHTIYTDFPQYPRADMAMMLEGYTYENDLHNTAKAKESYELYLTKYPEGKMTADVHFLIDHLGMTPEQIMAEIDSIKRSRGEEMPNSQEPGGNNQDTKEKTQQPAAKNPEPAAKNLEPVSKSQETRSKK